MASFCLFVFVLVGLASALDFPQTRLLVTVDMAKRVVTQRFDRTVTQGMEGMYKNRTIVMPELAGRKIRGKLSPNRERPFAITLPVIPATDFEDIDGVLYFCGAYLVNPYWGNGYKILWRSPNFYQKIALLDDVPIADIVSIVKLT